MTRILMIYTSADQALDGSQTGYYLPEAAHPYYTFKAANYDIDFVAPKGPNPPVDNDSVQIFKDEESVKFLSDPEVQAKLASAKTLSEVNIADYDAIFYIGGHGPVIDLATDKANIDLASQFYQTGKITAAVCHGTAALLNAKDRSGNTIFAGKKFTGFSNNEEEIVKKVSIIPFLLEDKIKALGGKYESAVEPWAPHVTIDGHLYTGQNPASAKPLADAIVKALG